MDVSRDTCFPLYVSFKPKKVVQRVTKKYSPKFFTKVGKSVCHYRNSAKMSLFYSTFTIFRFCNLTVCLSNIPSPPFFECYYAPLAKFLFPNRIGMSFSFFFFYIGQQNLSVKIFVKPHRCRRYECNSLMIQ